MAGTEAADEGGRPLLEMLLDLKPKQLSRFKALLFDIPVERGYKQVSRERLNGVDAVGVYDLLLDFYGEDHAPQLAAEVLDAAHCRAQAQRLREKAKHFIELHREELIKRTRMVEAVLDKLYGKILDDEQYQRITSRATSQDKMRELYNLVAGWNWACKERLLKALTETNEPLIEELEGRRRTRQKNIRRAKAGAGQRFI